MPQSCCISYCKYRSPVAASIGVPFHRFPRDDRLRRDWLIAIRSDDLPVDLTFEQLGRKMVCGKHFAPSDYERDFRHELLGSKKRNILKETAVPTTKWNRQQRESKSSKDARREVTESKVEKCRMRERLVREMMTLRAQLKSRAETVPTATDLVSEGDVRVEPMSDLNSGEEICEEPKPHLISTEHFKTELVSDLDHGEDETQCIDLLATKNNSTAVCSLGPNLTAFKVTKLELEPAQSCDSSAVEAETVNTPTSPSSVSSINAQSIDIETLEMECIDNCDSSGLEAETVDTATSLCGVSSSNGQSNDIETLEMECIDHCDSSVLKAETVDTATSRCGVSSSNGQSNDIETLEMECIDNCDSSVLKAETVNTATSPSCVSSINAKSNDIETLEMECIDNCDSSALETETVNTATSPSCVSSINAKSNDIETLEMECIDNCDSSVLKAETVNTATSRCGVSSINGQSNDIETLEMECIDVEDRTLADVESEPVDEGMTLTDICEPVTSVGLDAHVLMQNQNSTITFFNLGHLPRMNECSVKITESDIIAAKRRITEQTSPTAFTHEDFTDDIGSDEPYLASKKKKPKEDSDYEPQEDEQESEDESDYSSEEDLEEECESSPTKTKEFWHYLNDSKKSKVTKMYADLIEVVKPPSAESSDSLEGSVPTDLYRCNVCRVEYHLLVSIKRHIWKKEIYDPKQCTMCGETCSNTYSLTMHMKVNHISRRNYPCSVEGCAHVSKRKEGLKKHKATVHNKEINLPCTWENCNKTFRSAYSLRVHMRIHSDSKPVLCYLCAFRCRQKASLNWHMKTKHPDAPPP